MKNHQHVVMRVQPGSIAEELGIEPGDIIRKINNQVVKDIFDYHYLVDDEELDILLVKADGQEWELSIEKDYDEDLGIEFCNSLMDDYRSCYNKCIFCFIDQNPPGMRETIYFKDDDSRLSFLQGNYITLTNMAQEDLDRIIEYHLAPINISVHTTNPKLRCEMLNNRFAGTIMERLQLFYDARIPMNGQIVLCKGYNDGEELRRSLKDLLSFAPIMESVSVVPVGLSKYREGLCHLDPFLKEDCREVVSIIEEFQAIAMERFGMHFIHASDEWYIKGDLPIPEEDNYDGYIQLENGVGMTRLFMDEVDERLAEVMEEIDFSSVKQTTVSTVSGLLAYPYIKKCCEKIEVTFPNLKIELYPIRNDFFGEQITVTGLITGIDLKKQLSNQKLGQALLLPSNMLKADEDIFLDDTTLEDLQKTLQLPIRIVKSSGVDFVDCILEEMQSI